MNEIEIDGQKISKYHKPYIIAEISANHNHSIDTALRLIDAAAESGASAVKLQTYTPDTLTLDCSKPDFIIKDGLWKGYKLYDLYKEAHTPFEWHSTLFKHAKSKGITCFSTPFDETAVDLLESLDAPAYKIASFEAVDLPLVKYVAKTKKPMIISTGMANLEEIEEVVDAARTAGCIDLILLHCVSAYPAPANEINLATISDLSNRFSVLTGLSDHTLGTTVSITSVGMGATVIEKHFKLDQNDSGPDTSFSITPGELAYLCRESKVAWEAIGLPMYDRQLSEKSNMVFRRSIYVSKDMIKGDVFTRNNIRRVRPGWGLAPKYYDEILGGRALKNISIGTPMKWEYIDNDR